MAKSWSVEDSAQLYNIKGWGLKYFGVNAAGNVTMCPRRNPENNIDVKRVLDDVVSRGIKLPVLLRFQDILRDRVVQLNETFKKVIAEHKYTGRYFGVYPIKVNQLREIVEEIIDSGEPYNFGLEAGSKGELMAVLAMNNPENLTIVNGYKDEAMMRLALIGVKLGKKVFVVIEKLSELELLLKSSRELGVKPLIGLRARLQTPGAGKWKDSGGDTAKFGLTTPEILRAIEDLRSEGLTDCVKLLHFHIGSQITNIRTIKDAVKEGARFYAKLRQMGINLEYIDCGGGLGVDYDGTHTTGDSSINYTLKEYVSDVVYSIQEVCEAEKVPEPHIVTESGRSIVAHHALLVVSVFGAIEAGSNPISLEETFGEAPVVSELRDIDRGIDPKNLSESYHDAQQRREEAFSLFKLGYLSLEDRAKAESLFWRICRQIQKFIPKAKYVSEDLAEMAKSLYDQYLCNFSVFQSLPDCWAVNQLFPVIPLHRLNEEPTRLATLVDTTCDSDGKIDNYVGKRKVTDALPLHPINGDPYFLGIFLMGAYQSTMGDIHNLFGRVNEVHVFEDDEEPGGYYLEEIIHGQTVKDVLASIQYSGYELVRMIKTSIEARVKAGAIKPREGVDLLNEYEDVLRQYTYIDRDAKKAAPTAEGTEEKVSA